MTLPGWGDAGCSEDPRAHHPGARPAALPGRRARHGAGSAPAGGSSPSWAISTAWNRPRPWPVPCRPSRRPGSFRWPSALVRTPTPSASAPSLAFPAPSCGWSPSPGSTVPWGSTRGCALQAAPGLLLMCAGIGSPGTLAEVLRGYTGDRTAPQRHGSAGKRRQPALQPSRSGPAGLFRHHGPAARFPGSLSGQGTLTARGERRQARHRGCTPAF
jgi:hypothetical protein